MSHEDVSAEPVLFSTFTIFNNRYRVYFKRGSLQWAPERKNVGNTIIPIKDILSVAIAHDNSCNCNIPGIDNEAFLGTIPPSTQKHNKFLLHYAISPKTNILRTKSVVLQHEEPQQITAWMAAIQKALDDLDRPKRFLAFVNPNSGKRKGERLYRKFVEPILKMGNVKVELVVTRHVNHSKDYIMEQDLSKFDAILTVGGDGTVSEVVNALVRRRLRDLGRDPSDPRIDLPPVDIPIAIIPGGSTDCIAYTMTGSLDRKTAAINAIIGERSGLDVCSVSSDRGLIKCFLSLLGYGFLGDVLETSEKYRWMGPKRYDLAGFLKLCANRWYHCEVNMVLDERLPAMGYVCHRNCELCNKSNTITRKIRYQEHALSTIRESLDSATVESFENFKSQMMTISGKYFWITCANISCACPRSPVGVAPLAHPGDGTMDVLFIRPRSPIDVLRLLARSTSKDAGYNFYDLPFVETYKVREFSFRPLNRDLSNMDVNPDTAQGIGSSVWNCDGEIVRDSNVRVRNHRQLVQLLTRRTTSPQKPDGFSCLRHFGCSRVKEDYVT